MLSWGELNEMSRRMLKVSLDQIEQHPRHLVMMGILPRIDIKKIEALMCRRHPDMVGDGMALCYVVEKKYGENAVRFIEQFSLETEKTALCELKAEG